MQEGTGASVQRGSKEKMNQVAAKLERFAHTPNQTPRKASSTGGVQQHARHPGRRSQVNDTGTVAGTVSAAPEAKGALEGEPALDADSVVGGEVSMLAEEREPSLRDILMAVNNCKLSITDLAEQLKIIRNELLDVKKEVQVVGARTTALEERVSQVEDDVYPLKQEVSVLKNQLNACMQKMDSMENRMRRGNLRVLGLPEGCEGNNPIKFMEDWLKEKFGKDSFSDSFFIKHAHRLASRTPSPGGYPRPLIFKLLSFRDKATVLQKAREIRNIQHNGARILRLPETKSQIRRM